MDREITGPEIPEKEISTVLRTLTRVLEDKGKGPIVPGFLGGSYGYRTLFKNKVFQIHSYCWCDKEECPWCEQCECPESSFHHYVDGQEVTWEESKDFFDRKVPSSMDPNWESIADEINKRRTNKKFSLVCKYCTRPEGENGEGPR